MIRGERGDDASSIDVESEEICMSFFFSDNIYNFEFLTGTK